MAEGRGLINSIEIFQYYRLRHGAPLSLTAIIDIHEHCRRHFAPASGAARHRQNDLMWRNRELRSPLYEDRAPLHIEIENDGAIRGTSEESAATWFRRCDNTAFSIIDGDAALRLS